MDTIIELLDKYLAGKASAEEAVRVEAWIDGQGDPKAVWSEMSPQERSRYIERLYQHFTQTIGTRPSAAAHQAGSRRRTAGRWLAAAAVAAAVGAAWLFSRNTVRAPSQPQYVTVKTAIGTLRELTLPDSTHVWMNAAGTLKYPETFTNAERDVYLKGEAFFQVAPLKDHPFIVHAGGLETEVLGTSFNVSAYESEAVTVVVATGKVGISIPRRDRRNILTVSANQMATYERGRHALVRSEQADWQRYAAWRAGKLVFNHTSLPQVLRTLGRVFNLHFEMADKALSTRQITGEFDVHEPPELVVKAICLSIDADYTRTPGRLVIRKKN